MVQKPHLDENKLIVAKLDKIFAGYGRGKGQKAGVQVDALIIDPRCGEYLI